MAGVLSGIGIASHAVAAVAFAGLATLLAARRGREPFAVPVTLAAAISALWAASAAIVYLSATVRNPWVGHAETLRTAAWIAVLIMIVHRPLGFDRNPRSTFLLAAALGFIVALDFVLGSAIAGPAGTPTVFLLFVATRIVLAISGLVLLHNIYVSSEGGRGPGFRFLAIGIGVIFAYDLNLYTLQFLLGQAPSALLNSRGIANAFAVPLILLAFREDRPGSFTLSREAAFNTISFSVIGLYLIVMSVLAYFLRLAGGNWGVVLQVSFLTLTMILGALVVLSPRFRASLRVWIARNFYRYRYDYRKEWLGFIDKVAGDGKAMTAALSGGQPIRERILEATASVLDCPGGALFEPGPTGVFQQTARWHWRSLDVEELGEEFLPSSTLGRSLGAGLRILDFDDLRAGHALPDAGADGGGACCPPWAMADRSIWLAVPLVHRARLIAILLLERSPIVRDLNWEDYDLLRTLGQQGASYLAEAAAQAALDEAQAFDEFNRRFAFVMHDLKNGARFPQCPQAYGQCGIPRGSDGDPRHQCHQDARLACPTWQTVRGRPRRGKGRHAGRGCCGPGCCKRRNGRSCRNCPGRDPSFPSPAQRPRTGGRRAGDPRFWRCRAPCGDADAPRPECDRCQSLGGADPGHAEATPGPRRPCGQGSGPWHVGGFHPR